mgnify:FL=1
MRDFVDNELSTNLFNVDLGIANYDVHIGSNLMPALVADLLEDQTQNLVIIDNAVSNFVRENTQII